MGALPVQQWFWTNSWRNDVLDGWNLENYSITDSRHNLRGNYQIRPVPQAIGGEPILFKVRPILSFLFLSFLPPFLPTLIPAFLSPLPSFHKEYFCELLSARF